MCTNEKLQNDAQRVKWISSRDQVIRVNVQSEEQIRLLQALESEEGLEVNTQTHTHTNTNTHGLFCDASSFLGSLSQRVLPTSTKGKYSSAAPHF